MTTVKMSLDAIYTLAHSALIANGCDEPNAAAIADIVTRAERDGSHSHGLFRMPGYIGGLRSGKVDGKSKPTVNKRTPAVINVDGHGCYAPLAQAVGLPVLVEAANEIGIAAMSLTGVHHFAALWPETEYLADRGLVGVACTASKPTVAPAGSTEPLFGTNPLAFAWPRPGKTPVCFDMATSAMALGDVQIAARDGKKVPPGTGLDRDGNATTDPAKIAEGVLLPFGGYKGSAIALMVELLSAGLTSEAFSYEAAANDNNDGAPPQGGEMIIAMSPQLIAGDGWETHVEAFMDKLTSLEGVRVPGARRHKNRLDNSERSVNEELLKTIQDLI